MIVLAKGKWKIRHHDGLDEIVESDGTRELDLDHFAWIRQELPTRDASSCSGRKSEPKDQGD